MLTRPWRFAWLLLAAVFGFVAGCVLAAFTPQPPLLPRTESVPLPHHVPRFAGGASFRYAMAHDVLHERYPRHGADHYRERNRITREKLARLAPDDPARFPLIDDLAAGATRLGQLDEAIELLRAKLVQQQSRGMAGRDLYTTYANLGAILYHRHLADAMAGDESALDHAREGRDFVRKSVAVNPESHFGREQWQVAYGEFLLDAIDNPDLLTRFDFIGNRLDYTSDKPRDTGNPDLEYGHAAGRMYYRSDIMSRSRPLAENPTLVNHPAGWESIRQVRDYITKVGGEAGFPRPDLRAPFDEPLLGIIGMWRQGIGADPHFALCIGEIMLRVGQRHIAWAAFERASRLSEKFWPDPLMQQFLRDHCRKRQAEIQKALEQDQGRITE